jgi:hypothetical protein
MVGSRNQRFDSPLYVIAFQVSKTSNEREDFIKALWYCLHLPRTPFDFYRKPPMVFVATDKFERNHRIELLRFPDEFHEQAFEGWMKDAVLLLVPDELLEAAQRLAGRVGIPLGCVSFAQLSAATLARHWNEMSQLYNGLFPSILSNGDQPPTLTEQSYESASYLVHEFLARQIGEERYSLAEHNQAEPIHRLLSLHLGLRTAERIQREKLHIMDYTAHTSVQQDELRRLRVPFIIGTRTRAHEATPAIPASDRLWWQAFGVKTIEPALRDRALAFAIAHRSLARDGVPMAIGPVPSSLFRLLGQIEECFKARRRNGTAIWRLLRKLGPLSANLLEAHVSGVINAAESVTFFADFPLGLAFLPGDTAPLQCKLPVWYRPITPLAGTVEFEILERPMCFLRTGFRVLIAECLDPSDPIHPYTGAAWKFLQQHMKHVSGIECEFSQIHSVADLTRKVSERQVDVLIISAHGKHEKQSNIAGVLIGNEICVGSEFPVPPIVILSACHAMPRATGALSIADVLLLRGALTVVATLTTVDALRNAAFLFRLFAYMRGAVQGLTSFRTLADVWPAVLRTNALVDILSASKRLRKLMLDQWDQIVDMYIEWERDGRISPEHIYRDAETLLSAYASERLGNLAVEQTMKAQSYIPESMFYVLTGRPERIVLYDPSSEKLREQIGIFDAVGCPKSV